MMKSRRVRWTGHVAQMEGKRIEDTDGKPEGKKPQGRPRVVGGQY
jgi:hypothetical protein